MYSCKTASIVPKFPDLDYLREIWIEPGNPQPTSRRDHSAVMFNNIMYVYGGFVDQTGSSQEFWAFSTGDSIYFVSQCK